MAKTKKISTLAKTQKSYLNDITDLINFTRKDDSLKLRKKEWKLYAKFSNLFTWEKSKYQQLAQRNS